MLAAGVYPYATAQLVVQLLLPIFPKLEQRIKDEGEEGQRKMNQWVFRHCAPGSLVGIWSGPALSVPRRRHVRSSRTGWGPGQILPTITMLLTMTAGTMFAIWLGELITEQGIGNGLSLIIFGGIVSSVPGNLRSIAETDKVLGVLNSSLVITVPTMLFIVFVQDGGATHTRAIWQACAA